ncbi:MAG: RAMP superfamily CRISPR-associated protein [Candidatus Hodarchaeota archaeon]
MKIKIILTNKSPISIRENRADDVIYTLNYIPGHSFLGSLSAYYLKNNPVDERFQDFFVNGRVKYSPLYPSNQIIYNESSLEKRITDSESLTLPIPKTAFTCKRWPGFKIPGEKNEQHGVRDRLYEWTLFRLTSDNELKPLKSTSKCCFNGCKEEVTPIEGFYKIGVDYKEISSRKVTTQISMHTGINRSTGTVSPGILYSIESIQEDHQFTGLIEVEDKLVEDFRKFLYQAELRIGNKKTSGQGYCVINDLPEYHGEDIQKFRERLLKFDSEFKKTAADHGLEISDFYFSIDIFSDAIQMNDLLNYNIGFEDLIKNDFITDSKLIYENVSPFKVMGWNNTIKLPKQTEWATEKGSIAMVQIPDLNDEVVEKLYNLEQTGIGIRRIEGFGIIRISDQFHWEVR